MRMNFITGMVVFLMVGMVWAVVPQAHAEDSGNVLRGQTYKIIVEHPYGNITAKRDYGVSLDIEAYGTFETYNDHFTYFLLSIDGGKYELKGSYYNWSSGKNEPLKSSGKVLNITDVVNSNLDYLVKDGGHLKGFNMALFFDFRVLPVGTHHLNVKSLIMFDAIDGNVTFNVVKVEGAPLTGSSGGGINPYVIAGIGIAVVIAVIVAVVYAMRKRGVLR